MELAFQPRDHEFDYYSALVRQFLPGCQVGRFEHLREWFIRFLRQHRIDLPDLEKKILEYPLNNVGMRGPTSSTIAACHT